VAGGRGVFDEEKASSGQGPCVERGDALYIFDQAVLTAFDLKTGNVRWRLPSVGIDGLFFDDAGMMYVNTTTASPESIKYSRQIDVTKKTSALVLKVNPQTGKILWTANSGLVSYVSGKFIYTLDAYQGDDRKEENPYATGFEIPSHVMIRRLNPRNGREMWTHYQKRAPLDVRFDGKTIQLVFKKEVQVLTFLSL
jgi:outer membrane protein assembly factor BamB